MFDYDNCKDVMDAVSIVEQLPATVEALSSGMIGLSSCVWLLHAHGLLQLPECCEVLPIHCYRP
jgi:hypothetical protein